MGPYKTYSQSKCSPSLPSRTVEDKVPNYVKISSDYVHAFERLIKAYSQIADSLQRFHSLEQCFKDKPQLYPTFAIFYADILQFHKAAYKYVTRRCKQTLR